jgi:hypothetical protein
MSSESGAERAPQTGFPVVSIGAGDEADEQMEPGGPGLTVDVAVLLPTEKSHALRVDPVVEEAVARLTARGRPVVLLGVAPPYPLAVRALPGGIAKKNREDDATTLDRRCSAIRDAVRERDAKASVMVHVVAQGSADVGTMTVDGALAGARSSAERGRANTQRVAIGHVVIHPDSATMIGFTNAEIVLRAVLGARRPTDSPWTPQTSGEILRDPSGKLQRGRRARPNVSVCVVDTNSMEAFPPPHIAALLDRTLDGDEVVLFAPIPMPDAGEATQMSSVDWSAKLKQLDEGARRILADNVAAASRFLERRGIKADLRTTTSAKHHLQAVEDAVKSFTPRCVAVAEGYRRQHLMRSLWESVRGSEYERMYRANNAAGIFVA